MENAPMADAIRCTIRLAGIAEGQMLVRSINGREVIISRTQYGIDTLDNVCTHAYARRSQSQYGAASRRRMRSSSPAAGCNAVIGSALFCVE
jgi:nitrite reductase/ring-hydroxylating ferredoxin subunit